MDQSFAPSASFTGDGVSPEQVEVLIQASGQDVTMDNGQENTVKDGEINTFDHEGSASTRLDTTVYASAVAARNLNFVPTRSAASPKSYAIESIYTIPHSTPIHALALPPCSSHIYSGGPDGMIRRYNLDATLNGISGVENPNLHNLTAKYTDKAMPMLVGYWENEEEGLWCDNLSTDLKWGKKYDIIGKLSPVHSLAIHSQELWGLSGTAVCDVLFCIDQRCDWINAI